MAPAMTRRATRQRYERTFSSISADRDRHGVEDDVVEVEVEVVVVAAATRTVIFTADPLSTDLPPAGSCEMTRPA